MMIKRTARQHQPRTNERHWRRAEQKVGQLLANLLLDGCLVLNDVPFCYGNLDHVVIRSDRTIFLIETKAHRGQVRWDGRRLLINGRPFARNPLGQLNRSIRWIRNMAQQIFGVSPWIVAVLVFPNADVWVHRSVKRVNVLKARDMLGFIRNYQR